MKSVYDISNKTLIDVYITQKGSDKVLHMIFEADGLAKDKIGLHAEVREIRESVNGKIIYE